MYAEASHILLENGTLFIGCNASSAGKSIYPAAGAFVTYALPAPLDHYIAATECYVYRAACPRHPDTQEVKDKRCPETEHECQNRTEGNATVTASDSSSVPCQPILPLGQPCGAQLVIKLETLAR